MHANDSTINALAHLRDRKRRCVRSKYARLFANQVELREKLLLKLHLFKHRFYDEVAVAHVLCESCAYLAYNSVSYNLLHLTFSNELIQTLLYPLLSVIGKFLRYIAEYHFVTLCARKCLRDSGTHCSCTNYSDFHTASYLFSKGFGSCFDTNAVIAFT